MKRRRRCLVQEEVHEQACDFAGGRGWGGPGVNVYVGPRWGWYGPRRYYRPYAYSYGYPYGYYPYWRGRYWRGWY